MSSANGFTPIGRWKPIPAQFVSAVPNVANAFSTVGLAIAIYGLVVFAVWPVVAGILLVHTGKLWYIDRMVLLFDDVKHRDPEVGVVGVRLLRQYTPSGRALTASLGPVGHRARRSSCLGAREVGSSRR